MSNVSAQTAVIKYFPTSSGLMKFTLNVTVDPALIISADTVMKYGAAVTTANVSWTALASADQYKLELFDGQSSQWNELYVGPSNLLIAENLGIGSRHFRVKACSGGLCGGYSATATALIETNLDLDLDGVNNDNDLCPGTAQGVTVSAAGCVPSTVDTDNDGVTDDLDWCANTVAGEAANSRGCSPNQIDSDSDGTPDYQDAYPHQSALQCTP